MSIFAHRPLDPPQIEGTISVDRSAPIGFVSGDFRAGSVGCCFAGPLVVQYITALPLSLRLPFCWCVWLVFVFWICGSSLIRGGLSASTVCWCDRWCWLLYTGQIKEALFGFCALSPRVVMVAEWCVLFSPTVYGGGRWGGRAVAVCPRITACSF